MATILRADYEAIESMAQHSAALHDVHDDNLRRLCQCLDALVSGGWVGVGANAFFAEMDELVLPVTRQLIHALNETDVALRCLAAALRAAEEDSAALFNGDGGVSANAFPLTIQDFARLILGGGGLLGDLSELKTFAQKFPWLKNFDLPFGVEGLIDGLINWTAGEDDLLNSVGAGVTGEGLTLGLSAGIALLLGTPLAPVAAVVDGVILGSEVVGALGQADVWLERQLYSGMNLDPQAQAILNRGLAEADQTWKSVGLSSIIDSAGGLAWDIFGRPAVNDFNTALDHTWKALTTGSISELHQAVSSFGEMRMSATAPGMVMNFFTDPVAQQHAWQSAVNFVTAGKDFALAVPQVSDEVFRVPVRLGTATLSNFVNSVPMDNDLRHNLNTFINTTTEMVNTLPIGSFITTGPVGALVSVIADQFDD